MRHIFFVEDTETVRSSLTTMLQRAFEGVTVSGNGRPFDQAVAEILQVNPDICIIDLYDGELSNPDNRKGPTICKNIWEGNCRPIIVFTASEDTEDLKDLKEHPFFRLVKKGQTNSLEQVVVAIKELQPLITEIIGLETEVKQAVQVSIRESAQVLKMAGVSTEALPKATAYCARRRLAASFDLDSENAESEPWSQYIIPPVGPCLEFGDILRFKTATWDNAGAYRIVLTPSCDLVSGGTPPRKPKVKQVLVGECVSGIDLMKAWNYKKDTETKTIEQTLSQPQMNGYVCLPGLPGFMPMMGLRLRRLGFLQFTEIEISNSLPVGTATYRRIAGIDSPFREMLSWAFMQIAARPAVPERSTESLIQALIDVAEVRAT